MPSVVARIVAISAAPTPRKSDERVPQTTCEKMSTPWSVVPKKWCVDGACDWSNSEKSVGSCVAIRGAKIAISTIAVKTIRPKRDLRLRSSRRSQFGKRTRLRLVLGRGSAIGAMPVGSSGVPTGNWTCATALAPLARAHARVEDEVEHVHDEVRRRSR